MVPTTHHIPTQTLCLCPKVTYYCLFSSSVIDCDVLDGIANGYVTYMDGTLVNSTASYSCNTGYMFAPAANTMRTCTLTGLWDGTEPQCISKKAPMCMPHSEGISRPSARYCECVAHLMHTINTLRTSGIDCGNPDAPMNGLVEFNETTYQSVAVYSCNEGFILEGDRATTCNLAGQWIANTTCRSECPRVTSTGNRYTKHSTPLKEDNPVGGQVHHHTSTCTVVMNKHPIQTLGAVCVL